MAPHLVMSRAMAAALLPACRLVAWDVVYWLQAGVAAAECAAPVGHAAHHYARAQALPPCLLALKPTALVPAARGFDSLLP
mmetsp:Transcript_17216/g.43219  ORF Transcript_17216/g.43219 Transcript_17216/m.43219 type:complete len:81 (-) Transcript_17216:1894-2136(-)